jgi:hypothetical protein
MKRSGHLFPSSHLISRIDALQTGGANNRPTRLPNQTFSDTLYSISSDEEFPFIIKIENQAFNGELIRLKLTPKSNRIADNDWENFLFHFLNAMERIITLRMKTHGPSSFWPELDIIYQHGFEPEEIKLIPGVLNTERATILPGEDLKKVISKMSSQLRTRNENFLKQSNLFIYNISSAGVNISNFSPLSGSCDAKLPKYLQAKKAIVNVHNKDNRCFGYAILAAMKNQMVKKNQERYTNYSEKDFAQYGLNQISYPVDAYDIQSIEEQLQIGINVFSYYDDQGKACYPFFISKLNRNADQTIDLLYFNKHWAWIKNFSRFASSFVSKRIHKRFWCKRCFGSFWCQQSLQQHQKCCVRPDYVTVVYSMPTEENNKLSFKNFSYQQRAPFVAYVDFECYLEKIDEDSDDRQKGGINTLRDNVHIPCAVGLKVVSTRPGFSFPYEVIIDEPNTDYQGLDLSTRFLLRLLEVEQILLKELFK